MNRSPLKPGKPLKRTPLNRKRKSVKNPKPRKSLRKISVKNSRKWENRQFIKDYKAANRTDELRRHLSNCGFDVPSWNPPGRQEFECHHIFGNQGQKWDLISNVLSVRPSTHDWCHDHKHQSDWRIVALWVKLDKGELRLSEFVTVTGKNLAGYLEIVGRPAQSRLAEMFDELKAFSEGRV